MTAIVLRASLHAWYLKKYLLKEWFSKQMLIGELDGRSRGVFRSSEQPMANAVGRKKSRERGTRWRRGGRKGLEEGGVLILEGLRNPVKGSDSVLKTVGHP